MRNPFANSLEIVSRTLSNDTTLRFIYRKIPKGARAAYYFPPINSILLPPVDTSLFTREEQRTYTALTYHELRHHAITDGEQIKRSIDHSKIVKSLTNWIEDARIEVCPLFILRGGQQDLTEYRIEEVAKLRENEKNQFINPINWVMCALSRYLTPYGLINVDESLQEYYQIGKDILDDGRFQSAVLMDKKGTKIVVDIAIDIYNAWKEKNEKIDEQYEKEEPTEEDSLNKKVAEMGEEGEPLEENWWLANDKSEKVKNSNAKKISSEGDPYIPYTAQDREIIAKQFPEDFKIIESEIKNKVHMLQQQLSLILRNLTKSKTKRFLRHGELDPSVFYKAPKGSKLIKKQVSNGTNISAAITLLIDLSGSMRGESSHLAAQIATIFGEALLNMPNISFEIRGYNTSPTVNDGFATSYEKNELTRYSERINHWVFKKFYEDWRNVRNRMGSCLNTMNDIYPETGGSVGGCNCDHENLILASHHLYKQNKKNKIMIVLCDGMPSGHNFTYGGKLETELIKTVKKIKQSGINLFCFGIKAEEVKKYYSPDVEIIQDLNDFDEKALRKLVEMIVASSK